MSNSEFEIVTLKSGFKSLRSLERQETFHPGTGPEFEASRLHVEQQKLIERCCSESQARHPRFVIWDVGLGAAANALTAIRALLQAKNNTHPVEIHSFDQSTNALEFALKHSAELGYLSPFERTLEKLLEDQQVQLSPHLIWRFHLGDFVEQIKAHQNPNAGNLTPAPQAIFPAPQAIFPAPQAIFYDPYSLTENPNMWNLEHFKNLWRCLDPEVPCLLSNYTRSTAVRVTLSLAGFYVGRGCEIGEKAETTLASNDLSLLKYPLDESWLKRVQKSTHAAPLRSISTPFLFGPSDLPVNPLTDQLRLPISPQDYDLLKSGLQFRSLSG